MTSLFRRLRVPVFLALVLALSGPLGAADRKFQTSPTLATEARMLVKILEEAHYNRDAVRTEDYAEAIPDFMGELDSQHMFFLPERQTKFAEKFGRGVYYNTAFFGNIDAAYEIFESYESRTEARINWILEELKKRSILPRAKASASIAAKRSGRKARPRPTTFGGNG